MRDWLLPVIEGVASDDIPTRRIDTDDFPTVREFSPGQRVFSRYVLESLAGRGGMGVVWKARDERLDRMVALKLLPEAVAGDAEAVKDLLRETKRCLDLTHPHIVRVHDLVQDGPLAAISMEFVDGESLAKRKAGAPGSSLTLEELRPLVGQLCAALDYAHHVARVVHRDLKPANLLLTKDGQLKVTDFGIARSLSDTHTRLTGRVGNTSGTLLYMSPQQLLGADPAACDDIYALGVTLYELLVGKPPFHTGDVASQIREIAPKPLNERLAALGRTSVPAEWEETILACLAKEPENRPQSASEVAERLGLGVTTKPAKGHEKAPVADRAADRSAERRSKLALLMGLAVIGLGAACWWFFDSYLPGQRKIEAKRELRPNAARAKQTYPKAFDPVEFDPSQAVADGEPTEKQISPRPFDPAAYLADHPVPVVQVKLPGAEEGQAWTVPGLNLEMAYIQPGTFTMGSENDKPLTRVMLTKGYWLGKTEVTQGQWEALIGSNPASFKGADRPVERVSWNDAMQFCRKLTERERAVGRVPEGYEYTLPTEAQWEYAWRAGSTGDYTGNLDEVAWYNQNSGYTTHPVGQKQPNAWGLYDMLGNVKEWCQDWWYNFFPGGSVADPVGPASAASLHTHVLRGGNLISSASECRSASRGGLGGGSHMTIGFRVALAPQVIQAATKATKPNPFDSAATAHEFTVTVDPPDADARLWLGPRSDVEVWSGKAVLKDLPDGEQELTVQAPGYQPFTTRVTVKDGHGSVEAKLVPVWGSVSVTARPGTKVNAYDARYRETSLGVVPAGGVLAVDNLLTVGRYSLMLAHDDCSFVGVHDVDLVLGRTIKVAPAQTPLSGELRIFSMPTSAEVRVNGVVASQTPATLRGQPSEQSLRLEVFLRGYRRVEQVVTLKPKEVRSIDVGALTAESGAIELRFGDGKLGSAQVTIDGKPIQVERVVPNAPFVIERLEVGSRIMEIKHPDYEPWRQTVTVRKGEPTVVNAELKPRPGSVPVPANRTAEVSAVLEKLRGAEEGQAWTIPDLNLDMVYIRPGIFTMGSPNSEEGRSDDEGPQTRVTLTRGYWLGKTEVTQAQWEAMMGSNPANFKGADRPVEEVSWNEAMEFCRKLTERERQAGRLFDGYEYTLPTEAQWEYACRAGTTGAYAGILDAMAWYYQNSGNATHPVGQKQANAWGLYDMHGNVSEYCRDLLGEYPGGSVRDLTNPSSSDLFRCCRGGSGLQILDCRSASRDTIFSFTAAGQRCESIGFRIALARTTTAGIADGLPTQNVVSVYIVQPGDTSDKISKKTGASIHDLKKANPNLDLRLLRVGQRINVPSR